MCLKLSLRCVGLGYPNHVVTGMAFAEHAMHVKIYVVLYLTACDHSRDLLDELLYDSVATARV